MARLLWLPEVLRAAGLTVHEVPGWQTRGADYMWEQPAGVICHATAGSRRSTPAGDIHVLINGSETAPGPISQLYLGRTGEWWVVGSGVCHHAGRGGLWGVEGNQTVVGVEAANDNRGEPWPAVQYESYVTGVAAILRRINRPADRAAAHREWSGPRKSDPVGIDMTTFRAQVAAALEGDDDMAFTDEDKQMLREVHSLLRFGLRPAGAQTSGGVPIAWLPRAFHQLGVDLEQIVAEVDQVEELAATSDDDPAVLAAAISERLAPAQQAALMAALQRIKLTVTE